MAKKFQIIANSYDQSDKVLIAENLREKLAKIKAALEELGGNTFIVEDFYLTKSTENAEFQWRATCYVEKSGRKISWSDIYWAINTISIPVYESVSKEHVKALIDAQKKEVVDLRNRLGLLFESLATVPYDDVDNFINKGLKQHATNRTFAGWDGTLAVAKLKTLASMTREQIRSVATVDVNALIAKA